jgi:flavoprotein
MESKENKIEEFPTFLMNEQPAVCSICGARCEHLTDSLNNKTLMSCLDSSCQFIFFEEEDREFLTL